MLTASGPLTSLKDAGRERVLAKVYALLIRVAEEMEEQLDSPQQLGVTEQAGASELAAEAAKPKPMSPRESSGNSTNNSEQIDTPHLDN